MELVNPLISEDKFVYHYTKLNIALNYILKDGTLLFNDFLNVNDPRESKDWNFVVRLNLSLNADFDAMAKRVSNDLKSNVKIVCFSKDRKEAVNKWQPEGLLDRGFSRPSMWHHYADEHNGICLMFNREKLDNAFKRQIDKRKLISSKVQYSDDGILCAFGNDPFYIDLFGINSHEQYVETLNTHLSQWMRPLFFRKLKDWSNEEEYRWVYLDDNPKPRPLKFDDALEAVIIGEKVSKEFEDKLLRYCVTHKADKTNLIWNNGYPKLEYLGQPYITHNHLINE